MKIGLAFVLLVVAFGLLLAGVGLCHDVMCVVVCVYSYKVVLLFHFLTNVLLLPFGGTGPDQTR